MDRRTALISAASVVGVVLAGATAVGANIGILGQADNSGIGELSASTATTSTLEPDVIDVYLDESTSAQPSGSPASVRVELAPDGVSARPFAVEDAGVVEVLATEAGIGLGAVTANPGWAWTVDEAGDEDVSVTFESGETTYLFHASLAQDGSISARVEQPIVQTVTTSTPPATSATHDEDEDGEEHEGEDHEEDEEDEEDDGEDHDEHEGRDDDD